MLPQCCSSIWFQLLLVWEVFSAGGGGADLIRCGSSGNTSWFVILWSLSFLYTLQYSCKIIKPSRSCNQFTCSFALKLKQHHHGHSNQVLLQIPRAEFIPSQSGFFQGLHDSRNYSWYSSRFSLTTVQCCHPAGLPFMNAEVFPWWYLPLSDLGSLTSADCSLLLVITASQVWSLGVTVTTPLVGDVKSGNRAHHGHSKHPIGEIAGAAPFCYLRWVSHYRAATVLPTGRMNICHCLWTLLLSSFCLCLLLICCGKPGKQCKFSRLLFFPCSCCGRQTLSLRSRGLSFCDRYK